MDQDAPLNHTDARDQRIATNEGSPSEPSRSSNRTATLPPWVERWEEWYRMTPLERWHESQKLWQFYLAMGGSLDPEPDSQSPFNAILPSSSAPADGRPGVRIVRRSGV